MINFWLRMRVYERNNDVCIRCVVFLSARFKYNILILLAFTEDETFKISILMHIFTFNIAHFSIYSTN